MKATRIIKSKNLNKGKYEQLEEQTAKVKNFPTDFKAVADEWLVECKKEFEVILDADGELAYITAALSDFDRMVIKRRCLDNAQRNNFKGV